MAMAKKTVKIHYRYNGKLQDVKAIYQQNKKRRGRSISYDAMTAHVAIVFTRYMMLAIEQRQNTDMRTIGELFYCGVD